MIAPNRNRYSAGESPGGRQSGAGEAAAQWAEDASEDRREDPVAAAELEAPVEAVFGREGLLVSALGLEFRPQQTLMAREAAAAFSQDRSLLFEAGTGVGKSLAYLIPALVHARNERRQALVSTHTISLQEQILHKDLELCRSILRQTEELSGYADFRVAMLVGRGNYLCTTRLARAIESRTELFQSREGEELERIAHWSAETAEGLLHELSPPPDPEVWDWVNADTTACNRRNCSADTCFYQRARARLEKAHLIVVNHSLLCALIGAGAVPHGSTPGVLFPKDFAVIDEAHTLPAVATDHFGAFLSAVGLERLLKQLHHPRRKRGLLKRLGHTSDLKLVEEALRTGGRFFADVRERVLAGKDILRLRTPLWAEDMLHRPLIALEQRLAALTDGAEPEALQQELRDLRLRTQAARMTATACIELSDTQQVYWAERTGKTGRNVALRTAPIDIACELKRAFFERGTSVVMTSATLGEGEAMRGFIDRVGGEGSRALKVDSPFDYPRQMEIWIAADGPDPVREMRAAWIDFLADRIFRLGAGREGGTLALFTSHADLRDVASDIDARWRALGRALLVQGRDGGRSAIAERFRQAGNALLMGTDSFWTGVDIPGPALEQVIIARLPFDNPTHPVAEARAERIRERGGDPFLELTLPDAVVKLRQGIGRLIRRREDSGRVVLLDSRLLTRRYGRRLLAALPHASFRRFQGADLT